VNEPFPRGTFRALFPLWSLFHSTTMAKGMMVLNGSGGEKATPFFTDNDLAKRFQESTPALMRGYTLGMIESPESLLPVLDILESKGFTHVCIDYYGPRARFCRIDQLRSSAQRPQN
jgi:hypothetical protein